MNVIVSNLKINLEPAGFLAEELEVGDTVVTARKCESLYALVSVKKNPIKVTFDGTSPVTAGAGIVFDKGVYTWHRNWVNKAKFIEATGGSSATVRIERMN